ncbi:MAG: ParB N-terminal domain-containing protein [Oscillospiraceae bacterium]|nr:ParB N-terminal domain-containing protein [Oscillospiraceae bacterium]
MNTTKPPPKPILELDESLLFQPHPDFINKNIETEENEDTLTVAENNSVSEMAFSKMKSFPNHPFRLYGGTRLDDMVESIKQAGILFPIMLWDKGNNVYFILSGHNRVNAGKLAGLTKGPVIIKENLTDEEAMFIVTETNLRQRGFLEMSYSERAISLKNNYEAVKCQGKRNDLINEIETLINPHSDSVEEASSQVATRFRADEKIASENGISKDTVARYVRLATHLDPHLLAYVDTGNIPFLAAYDLSFIENKEMQKLIIDIIKRDNCKVDMKMAALLRKYSEKRALTKEIIEQILSGEKTRKPKSDKPKPFSLKPAFIKKHFPESKTPAEIEEIIDKALSEYLSKEIPA